MSKLHVDIKNGHQTFRIHVSDIPKIIKQLQKEKRNYLLIVNGVPIEGFVLFKDAIETLMAYYKNDTNKQTLPNLSLPIEPDRLVVEGNWYAEIQTIKADEDDDE